MTHTDARPDQDREAILKVHKDWWEANDGIDVPRMRTCFPVGKSFLMFNSNGHPYFGVDELAHLWEHYRDQLEISEVHAAVMELRICGDMAWLACEGSSRVRVVGAEGTGTETIQVDAEEGIVMRFRATEVYERNDGEGGGEWRMWHFHGSSLSPQHELRPGFSDTGLDRGLGGIPWHEPFEVVGR